MQVLENFALRSYNTFGIDAFAEHFVAIHNVQELNEALAWNKRAACLLLGGGSNILFTKNVPGLVIRNEIKGIQKLREDEEFVYVRCGAGEVWHNLVLHTIAQGWGGLENLSLIPGCTGASPMQNIGAYGVEIKDVFHELTAFHLEEKTNYTFRAKDCDFGYRESVFKRKYKGQFAILDVTFRLRKHPVFQTSYGAISKELETMGVTSLSVKAISDAVIRIRSSKLPDPLKIGNAGSFFKNPSVSAGKFAELRDAFEGIVGYPNEDGTVKLAAGWLIEHCGPEEGSSWKGYRNGDAGCHKDQALVLVNYGTASGSQVFELSTRILESVQAKYGVELEREVNIL